MKVFKKGKDLTELKQSKFKLEKDIQLIIEKNLKSLLDLEFVETEYILKDYRFDTVAFNYQSNSFVIIEYKRGNSQSLVDQGYAYLNRFLDYKANLVLLYNRKYNKSLQVEDFDWSATRIYFISQHFTKYQIDSTSFKDMPFSLFEINSFEDNILIFEEVSKQSDTSVKEVVQNSDNKIKDVSKEVIVYTEEYHLNNKSEFAVELYNDFKERFLDLGDTSLEFKKMYITFKDSEGVCQIKIQKSSLKVYINFNRNKEFLNKVDLKKVRDVSSIGHHGSFDYEFNVKSHDDIDDLIYYCRKIILD